MSGNDPYRVVETKKYRRHKEEYDAQVALYARSIPKQRTALIETTDDEGRTTLHRLVNRMNRGR